MTICFVAISLSLVIIGVVSLAPISSVKRKPAKAQIHLSTNCKAKIGTSILHYGAGTDGALEEKKICLVKQKATHIITVRTLSHFLSKCAKVHD